MNEAEQLIIALGLPAEGKMLVKFLKAENKWLRENLDVKNAILALRDDENERLRDCFRIACEVLARDDIELDAYGHKIMIERMREETKGGE
jgi:hypothetical protein